MKTLICMILDRSGSMASRAADVIGGVNTFLAEQKKLPDPARIMLVRFDSEGIEDFRPMEDLQWCAPLRADEYIPRAATPLLDAIGRTLNKLDRHVTELQPDRIVVVIVTDGLENASKEFRRESIKAMIEARQETGKWSFVYIGANIDSFAEAGSLGVWVSNTANYRPTANGIRAAYAAVSDTVSSVRMTGNVAAQNLGSDIPEDYKTGSGHGQGK